jgi:hypothetical protein
VLPDLFAADAHVEVEATWGIYQRMIAAYREPDRARGKKLMQKLIASVSCGVPAALQEVTALGRTLKKRATEVLAYFDRPGTSNGPTKRSTAGLCLRPETSDPDYTLDREEPGKNGISYGASRTGTLSTLTTIGMNGRRYWPRRALRTFGCTTHATPPERCWGSCTWTCT